MNFLKKYGVALLVMCGTTNLFGLEVSNEIDFFAGYRYDRIKHHASLDFVTPLDDGAVTAKARSKADDINIGEIGIDIRYFMPQLDCCCEFPWLSNFYLDGYASWGWGGKSKTKSRFTEYSATGTEIVSYHHDHKIKSVDVQDYQIGLGYLLYNCDCFAWGITGGWSYDRQKLKHHADHYDYKISQRWNSGYLGTELFYGWCEWLLNAGYEYHWADLHSDGVKSHRADGNVVYVDGTYQLCDCWDVGFCFKWRDFDARRGKIHGDDVLKGGHAKARWESYSIVAKVGYGF